MSAEKLAKNEGEKQVEKARRPNLMRRIAQAAFELEGKDKKYLLSEQFRSGWKLFGRTNNLTRDDKKALKQQWQIVCKKWDEDVGIDMPLELGKMLQEIIEDPNYELGIHHSDRVSSKNFEHDETLRSILTEGLAVFGDASAGIKDENPPISKTVSMCPNMLVAINETKGSRKNLFGAVVVKVPSKYVEKDGLVKDGMRDKVYNYNESGVAYIKPEFLLGFVQNLGEGSTLRFMSREDILNHKDEE